MEQDVEHGHGVRSRAALLVRKRLTQHVVYPAHRVFVPSHFLFQRANELRIGANSAERRGLARQLRKLRNLAVRVRRRFPRPPEKRGHRARGDATPPRDTLCLPLFVIVCSLIFSRLAGTFGDSQAARFCSFSFVQGHTPPLSGDRLARPPRA